MYKKEIILIIVICICVVFAYKKQQKQISSITPLQSPIIIEDKPEEISPLDSITLKELKEDLYYLASDELEGRMSGKKGNITAADFIKKHFEKLGIQCEYQKFPIKRMNPGPKNETGDNFTQNIIGWIEGENPNEIVVIGAHMDHIGYGPAMARDRQIGVHNGADDNASGTVALLEIAEAFSFNKEKLKRTIAFQAYSAEEMGLIGSRYYCDHPILPKNNPNINKHVAMVNMDMIGYLGHGKYFAGFFEGESSIDLSKIINQLNEKYNFAKNITSRGSGGSDHASFYNKRIPIAFLHTGLHDYYHTTKDDPDRINYSGMEQITKYAYELIYQICQAESTPKFNHTTYKAMPYTHDHGVQEFHHYHSISE